MYKRQASKGLSKYQRSDNDSDDQSTWYDVGTNMHTRLPFSIAFRESVVRVRFFASTVYIAHLVIELPAKQMRMVLATFYLFLCARAQTKLVSVA